MAKSECFGSFVSYKNKIVFDYTSKRNVNLIENENNEPAMRAKMFFAYFALFHDTCDYQICKLCKMDLSSHKTSRQFSKHLIAFSKKNHYCFSSNSLQTSF